jgi:hypothetical protein
MIRPDELTILNEKDLEIILKIEGMIDTGLKTNRGTYELLMFDNFGNDEERFDDRIWSQIVRRYDAAGWAVSIRRYGEACQLKVEHPSISLDRAVS